MRKQVGALQGRSLVLYAQLLDKSKPCLIRAGEALHGGGASVAPPDLLPDRDRGALGRSASRGRVLHVARLAGLPAALPPRK